MLISALAPAASSAAGPPLVTNTTFSAVTTTSATLEATLNPDGAKTDPYHFEYVDQASFLASGFAEASTTPDGPVLNGTAGTPVAAVLEGLAPATTYHFRLFAHNTKGDTEGPEATFATYAATPAFGPCPNDVFRSGEYAPPGHPSAALPDCRAYEQASPVNKDGGDAIATIPLTKAAPDGNAVSFTTTAGIPGGRGAQEIPSYLASRGPGESGWSTRGLQPPASSGAFARVLGWTPDFSSVYSFAGPDRSSATLLAQPGTGGPPIEVVPAQTVPSYALIGTAGGGSVVLFESHAALGSPSGVPGVSNVYAWDRESGQVSLAGVMNDGQPPAKGAFGGPYDWARGASATNRGGAALNYDTQDTHAVTSDGSVYFTAAGSGQLYLRRNPTKPQSAVLHAGQPDEECTEADKACTIHLSATHRTVPDPAGAAPAAFQAASAGGSTAYFTSSAKLTYDANTGPEQPAPAIGRSNIDGVTEIEQGWLPGRRATGLAVDGEHVYWADPVDGTIGRAELGGGKPEPNFIELGPTTVEEKVENPPGSGEFELITEEVPSRPRYVAVDSGHVYWTNGADGKEQHGTVGRSDLDGTPASVEPECITGASNPQGIAVKAEHIYWANDGTRRIGRADIDCEAAEFQYYQPSNPSLSLQGIALTATHLYWTSIEEGSHVSYLRRLPLQGPAKEESPSDGGVDEFNGSSLVGEPKLARGIAVAGDNVYWAAQGGKLIGHAVWPDADTKPTTVEKEFLPLEGAPSGLAVDAEHIYWSTNGESQPNPGNDLYRFRQNGAGGCGEAGGCLEDLTPDPTDTNGAEVQGVLAASADGSRVYFAANAVLTNTPNLAGEHPVPGTCKGPLRSMKGQCSLYLWHEGTTSFIARLDVTPPVSDSSNWEPTLTGDSDRIPKTSFLSADGETLLFSSKEQLTGYDNHGSFELYRYREGQPLICVSCDPTGGAPVGRVSLGSIKPSALHGEAPAALASRNLSSDGDRAFFETTEALVAADTDAAGGCPQVGSLLQNFPACQDVYEWEAPGSGTCTEPSSPYSPPNGGCLYLLTPGDDATPSLFADASASGDDVFFFSRAPLVGQDQDQLLDLYDARALGGLASQNPPPAPPPCEAEGCKPSSKPAPQVPGAATAGFHGPGNLAEKPCKKGFVKKHGRCGRKHHKPKHKTHRHHRGGRR